MIDENLTVEIELPRDMIAGLNVPVHRLPAQVKEWVVLEVFRQGRISGGKAAELLALTRDGFHELLARYQIPLFDSVPGELESDLQVAGEAMEQARSR
jgi:predicted HTH domain antitoxin